MTLDDFIYVVQSEHSEASRLAKKFVPSYTFRVTSEDNFLAAMSHDSKTVILSITKAAMYIAEIIDIYKATGKYPSSIIKMLKDFNVEPNDEYSTVKLISYFIILGIYLHEVAHVMYTPVHSKYETKIKDLGLNVPVKFVHFIANLVEDAYIQRRFLFDFTFKKAQHAMRIVEEAIQGPQAVKRLNNQTNADIKQLLFYLVLVRYNRGIKTPLPQDIVSEFLNIYYVESAEERVRLTVLFADRLFNFLKKFEQNKHIEKEKAKQQEQQQDESNDQTLGDTSMTPPSEEEDQKSEEKGKSSGLTDNDNIMDNKEEEEESNDNEDTKEEQEEQKSEEATDSNEEGDSEGNESGDSDEGEDSKANGLEDDESTDGDEGNSSETGDEEGSEAEGEDNESTPDDGDGDSSEDNATGDDGGEEKDNGSTSDDKKGSDSAESSDNNTKDSSQGESSGGVGQGDDDIENLSDEELEDIINDIIDELLEEEDIQHEGEDKVDVKVNSKQQEAELLSEVQLEPYNMASRLVSKLPNIGEQISKAFQAAFKRIQSYTFNSINYGRKKGRFDQKIAYKTAITNRVFYKREEPKRDMDLFTLITLDASGSMNDFMGVENLRLIDYFRSVTIALIHALEQVRVKTELLVFSDRTIKVKGIDQRTHKEKLLAHSENMYQRYLGGGTRILKSLEYADNIFKGKSFKDKVFIIFTDGCFSDPESSVKSYANSLQKQGILVVIVGIDLMMSIVREFEDIFPHAYVRNYTGAQDLRDKLPKDLTTYLTNKFMKNKN